VFENRFLSSVFGPKRDEVTGQWRKLPEGKRPLGRPRRRGKDGIGMDLWEIGWGLLSGVSWLRIGAGGGCCECVDERSYRNSCGL
jgi:hypothetical protein